MTKPPERFREAHANTVQASINCDTLRESLRLAEREQAEFDAEMTDARQALVAWALDGADSEQEDTDVDV